MGNTEWQTPPGVFRDLHQEFGFTLDAAASADNALLRPHAPTCPDAKDNLLDGGWCYGCGQYIGKYYTKEDDGLAQDWAGERVFVNPPYSQAVLKKWVEKAATSGAEVVVALLPPSIDTAWFHNYVWDDRLDRPRGGVELRIPRGRIHFINPDGSSRPPTGNLIVVFHGED